MRRLFLASLFALGAVLALLCLPAMADIVARQDGDSVRLTDQPCPEAVLQKIHPARRDRYSLAVAVVERVTYAACWTLIVERAHVHVVYSDGAAGWIPAAHFRDEPGV